MTITEHTSPRLFDKYEIQERITTTGLATVYKAIHPAHGTVALKVPLAYFARDSQLMERFLETMSRVRELRHPNIVRVTALESDESGTAVAMEYMPWPTLKTRRPRPSPGDTLHILRQVASALDYAHSHGVLHRDLRPSNVFYNPETGEVKVSDFGTIALVEGGHVLLRSTVNTPNSSYTPLEQLQGLSPDPRNDVYFLGALAYELLTGALPFDALSPHTVLTRQLTSSPQPPSRVEPALPQTLDTVLLKALHRRMGERYATCGEMVDALEEALRTAGVERSAVPAPQTEEAGAPAPAEQTETTPAAARVICPHCGAGNSAQAPRCSNCWMTLGSQPQITTEEEQRAIRAFAARLRKRKRLIRTLTSVTLAIAVAFWAFAVIEIRPPLSAPATEISSESAEGEWAMVGRNALHTGSVPGPAFVAEGQAKWTFQSKGPILATPTVADGRVFIATSDERIVAVDETSGEVAWTHEVSGPINSSPTKAGDYIYVGQRDGQILALDADTGHLRWSYKTDKAMYGSFTVVDGALYAGSTDRFLYAFDASTGDLRWKRETENWLVGTPAVVDGIVVIAGQDAELYMVDASNGTLRNQFGVGAGVDNSPLVLGEIAYVPTRGGRIIAYEYKEKDAPFRKALWSLRLQLWFWNGADPETRPIPAGLAWAVDLGGDEIILSDLATDGEQLFVPAFNGRLRAMDPSNGKRIWMQEGLGKLRASPIVSGDTVIQVSSNGTIYGFDTETGTERWTSRLGEEVLASPVLADGTLYIGTVNGNVYALE